MKMDLSEWNELTQEQVDRVKDIVPKGVPIELMHMTFVDVVFPGPAEPPARIKLVSSEKRVPLNRRSRSFWRIKK